jgi:hypothetical protein
MLLIILNDYKKAEKLIKHAYTVKGVNQKAMQYREGLLNEFRKFCFCKKNNETGLQQFL